MHDYLSLSQYTQPNHSNSCCSYFEWLFSLWSPGGMETFLPTYPNLCNSNNPSKALSPTLMILPPVSDANPGLDTPEGTPVEILPFLYLGSAKDSSDLRILRNMKITAVLNITTSCPNHFESHFEYKSIPVEDSQEADLLSRLQTAISFIGKYIIIS